MSDYGKRTDGTDKGTGWFGKLPMQDGSNTEATELSTSFNYGNGDVLVPLLNPKLTEAEKLHLLQGKPPTESILKKAGDFGYERLQQGKSPFIQEDEMRTGNGLVNYRGN